MARGAIHWIGDGKIDTETIETIDGGETDFGTPGTVTNSLPDSFQATRKRLLLILGALSAQPAR